jgi:hypothetical protein
MDLQKAWNKLEHDRLEKPAAWQLPRHPEKGRSRHPVIKLRNSLFLTLIFSVVFLFTFVVLIFLFDHWLVKFFIGTIIAAYVFFTVYNYRAYRAVKAQMANAFAGSLKSALQSIHDCVYRSIRFQEKAALFIYPFSVTAGFMMGLAEHNNFDEDIQNIKIIAALLIAILILTPLSYYAARWMYKITYDKYLDQIKKLSEELDRAE